MNNKLSHLCIFIILIFIALMYCFSFEEEAQIKLIPSGGINSITTPINKNVAIEKDSLSIVKSSNVLYKKQIVNIKALKDTNLSIKLSSGVYKHNRLAITEEYSPIIVYKNFEVNHNGVINKVFDKEYIQDIPFEQDVNLKKGDTIELSFKYHTHSNNSYFILMSILGLFYLISLFCKNINIAEFFVKKYNEIPQLYKTTFYVSLSCMVGVYFLHITNCFNGNHDWIYKTKGLPLDDMLCMGRYSAHLVKGLLFGGQYVPVFSDIVAFMSFSISAIMLVTYWKLPKKCLYYIICALLFVLQPFTLEWLYYVGALPDLFFTPIYIIAGLMLADRTILFYKEKNIIKFLSYNIFSIVLLNISISVYPSLINTIAVVFFGKLFIELLDWTGTKKQLKSILINFVPATINIIIAMVIFKIILLILKISGKLMELYTIEQISLADLPQRFIDCFAISFLQLGSYSFPFMPNSICLIFTALLILLVVILISQKKPLYVLITQLFILLLTLFLTKFATLVCGEPQFLEPRIDIFGLHFFRILVVCVLFTFFIKREQKLLNFLILCTCFIIGISAVNDSLALKNWIMGLDAEKLEFNRIYNQIVANSNYNPSTEYNFIQIGEIKPLRKHFYNDIYIKQYQSKGLLSHSFDPQWSPGYAIEMVTGKHFIKNHYNSVYSSGIEDYRKLISTIYNKGLLNNAKTWPNKSSIIINEDTIIFIVDVDELNKIIENKGIVKNNEEN